MTRRTFVATLALLALVLCRQIGEAHEGSLKLENRPDGCGAQR